jgi:hypothetical protein
MQKCSILFCSIAILCCFLNNECANVQNGASNNNEIDTSELNIEKNIIENHDNGEKKGPTQNKIHRKKRPPQVGHKRSYNAYNNEAWRIFEQRERKSRIINLPDNWDRIPYIMQTYKFVFS